jgi:hypothetical protein
MLQEFGDQECPSTMYLQDLTYARQGYQEDNQARKTSQANSYQTKTAILEHAQREI